MPRAVESTSMKSTGYAVQKSGASRSALPPRGGVRSGRLVGPLHVDSRRSIAWDECSAPGRADAFEASFMNGRSWRNRRLRPPTAIERIALVHRAGRSEGISPEPKFASCLAIQESFFRRPPEHARLGCGKRAVGDDADRAEQGDAGEDARRRPSGHAARTRVCLLSPFGLLASPEPRRTMRGADPCQPPAFAAAPGGAMAGIFDCSTEPRAPAARARAGRRNR
jgi:hypothetical protein